MNVRIFIIIFSLIFFTIGAAAKDDAVTLPTMTTTVKSDKGSGATFLITKKNITNSNAKSVLDVLKSNGVTVLSYGNQKKPSIHAFTDECVRVYVDGVCINNIQTGEVDLSVIDIDSVESIKVDRSGAAGGLGAAAVYITLSNSFNSSGDVAGGGGDVANSGDGNKVRSNIAFGAGSDFTTYFNKDSALDTITNKFRVTAGVGGNIFSTYCRATYSKGDFLYTGRDGVEEERANNALLGGGATFCANIPLRVGEIFIREIFDIKGSEVAGPMYSNGKGKNFNVMNIADLGLAVDVISDIASGDFSIDWVCNKRLYSDSGGDSDHFTNEARFNAAFKIDACTFFMQVFKSTLSVSTLKSSDSGDHTLFSSESTSSSEFFLGDFTLKGVVSLFTSGKNIRLVPNFMAEVTLPIFSAAVSCHRYCTFPTLDDLYWLGDATFSGNSDLRSEDGVGATLDLAFYNSESNFKGGRAVEWRISATPFITYYKDKVSWQNIRGKYQSVNMTSAIFSGVDAAFNVDLFNIAVLRGNFGYLYTRFLGGSLSGKRIMWSPAFTGLLGFDIGCSALLFSFESNYIGRRYTSNENLKTMDDVFLFSAMVEVRAIRHFKPYVLLENMGNYDWESVPDYPNERFSLTIGLKYNSK